MHLLSLEIIAAVVANRKGRSRSLRVHIPVKDPLWHPGHIPDNDFNKSGDVLGWGKLKHAGAMGAARFRPIPGNSKPRS